MVNNKLVTFDSSIDNITWSKNSNIIVAFHEAAQKSNAKAEFYFYDVNKGEVIHKHQVFSLKEAQFKWHPNGKKLIVQCVKGKKTVLMVFTIEDVITTALIELNAKPQYIDVNPVKQQFYMLAYPNSKKGEEATYPTLYIYDISGKDIKSMKSLPNQEIKSFYFSPNGQFVVLSGMGTSEPCLYFYNTDRMNRMYKKVPLENISYMAWDPMGLYFVAVRSYLYSRHAKNGYMIFDSFGNQKKDSFKENFGGFIWRPHPVQIVDESLAKEIKAKYNECIDQMKAEDEKERIEAETKQKEEAEKKLNRYKEIIAKNSKIAKELKLHANDDAYEIIVKDEEQFKLQ